MERGIMHLATLPKKCNKYSKPINTPVIAAIIVARCDELRGTFVPACHYCCCFANVGDIVAACRYGTSVAGSRHAYHQQLNQIKLRPETEGGKMDQSVLSGDLVGKQCRKS